jgi:hypothetical protein
VAALDRRQRRAPRHISSQAARYATRVAPWDEPVATKALLSELETQVLDRRLLTFTGKRDRDGKAIYMRGRRRN